MFFCAQNKTDQTSVCLYYAFATKAFQWVLIDVIFVRGLQFPLEVKRVSVYNTFEWASKTTGFLYIVFVQTCISVKTSGCL